MNPIKIINDLSVENRKDIRKALIYKKGRLYYDKQLVYSLRSSSLLSVDIIEFEEDFICLSGRIKSPLISDLQLFIKDEDEKIINIDKSVMKPTTLNKSIIYADDYMITYAYEIKLKKEPKEYIFYVAYKGNNPVRVRVHMGKHVPLSDNMDEMCMDREGICIRYNSLENKFIVEKSGSVGRLKNRENALRRCIKDLKINMLFYRIYGHLSNLFKKKSIWIIMDRINVAGDNAEHFFKYVRRIDDKNIKPYFVLAKNSPDFQRISKFGKVIPYGSIKHKLKLISSSEIVSSQAEDNIYNPWGKDGKYIKNLLKYNYNFLQHGIIKDDLSDWLNKFNKNLKLFVTSAKPEYNAVLSDDYFYDESVVKLTGLPRYDTLIHGNNPLKSILIMPTWRMGLTLPMDKEGVHPYNAMFKESEYYKFYQNLMNHEKLNAKMEEYGYVGRFVIHAHHMSQIGDFKPSENFMIIENPDYQEEFKENAILVTDYSSVAFDFAYLKKPIIYAQFDENSFYENQIYNKGYFDYKNDGLGDVCETLEDTVDDIIKYMENGCKTEEKYLNRIEEFYGFFDAENSKRIYDIIVNRK